MTTKPRGVLLKAAPHGWTSSERVRGSFARFGGARLTTGWVENLQEPDNGESVDSQEDRWGKLEEIVRRVVREEIAALGKKAKLDFINGKWVGITKEQMEAWRAAYGAVDIDAELKLAAAWIVSNPHKAPRQQIGRFLNTWFARTQDRSSIRSIPTRNETVAPLKSLCSYCTKVATARPNRIWACDEHFTKAMDNEPVPALKASA